MAKPTDEELESQSREAQEATPGGISQPGGPWQERVRTQYRERTSPGRDGRRRTAERFDQLPRPARSFIFAAIAVTMASGVVLGAPTLRLRGDYLAIVTLGFGEIVRITANNLTSITNGALGINQIPNPAINVGSFHYDFGLNNAPYYWLLLGFIVIWIFLLRRVDSSRIGRAWAAIREDEVAAAAMGVPTGRMKLVAFAMGAGVAAVGGVVYARPLSYIKPGSVQLFSSDF